MNSKANWSLQPDENSLLLFFFIFFFAVVFTGLCVSALLRKKKNNNATLINNGYGHREDDDDEEEEEEEECSGWERTKKMLAGTLRWSEAKRWQDEWASTAEMRSCNSGRDGHRNAMASPLWQRRILMGEKCELPRFSGVILYDEHGFPLHHSPREETDRPSYQEEPLKVLTTLRDLL
ncbi:hypothetical protein J5N97_007584 [Dioscorea zingiberensis]|uniref:Transmembrane protein n=1 Tax=Dioscorea zingiberensis TaxID=325984 RepID=A0A9D5DDQ6_9LILI|nr:hypothetical protein J5N97_007584 [Dioscorea zingiberensis]